MRSICWMFGSENVASLEGEQNDYKCCVKTRISGTVLIIHLADKDDAIKWVEKTLKEKMGLKPCKASNVEMRFVE